MAKSRRRKNKEMSMLKIHEILRLGLNEHRSYREIAQSCQVSIGAVSKYLNKTKDAQISYTQVKEIDESRIRQLLKIDAISILGKIKPIPDFVEMHQELKNKNVTLCLLWEEYKELFPEGYQYSRYCHHYHQWRKKLNVSMRQIHKAGEKMFVDYAGATVPIYSRKDGKILFNAAIFVACLGSSQYTYAEATKDQKLASWINSHVRSFKYFKGIPEIVVPDNLKNGVSKACYYEPELNPSYCEMAQHYNTTVIPARVRKPKDKAKVENAVQLVNRWILARLRKRQFFSLIELNRLIAELLEELNNRPFKKMPGTRRSQYELIDLPALSSLPEVPYRLHCWKKARVNIDYHIELEGHYYSVPYGLVGESVDVRYTDRTVEILRKNKRVASHQRNDTRAQFTTLTEHMPRSHQDYKGWTQERFMTWANRIGPSTAEVVYHVLNSRKHQSQSFRSCLGILSLAKKYTDIRLEDAARKALSINA